MCALIGSSCWVMFATKQGWPVSTTHSIVGALIGVGVSAFGTSAVNWGWEGKGVAQIVASWLLSPILAGLIAVTVYGLTRKFVFQAKNPLRAGIYAIPFYFTITTFIVSFFVVSKNGKSTLKITAASFGSPLVVKGDLAMCMAIVGGITGFVLLFCLVCVVPFFIRKLEKEEDLKSHQIFYIFAVPTQAKSLTLDYDLTKQFTPHLLSDEKEVPVVVEPELEYKSAIDYVKNPIIGTYRLAMKGLFMDVASVQSGHAHDAHAHATLYDNKVEYLFSYLQVMTAAFASFSH
ncbi:hypothetical protein HDU98_004452, partial [Podochytrium sp. JEL0797]